MISLCQLCGTVQTGIVVPLFPECLAGNSEVPREIRKAIETAARVKPGCRVTAWRCADSDGNWQGVVDVKREVTL